MKFLKNLFSKKEEPIHSYADFWKWFKKNEKSFFEIIKTQKNIEQNFFDKLSSKLDELKKDYSFLVGMLTENIAELVLTADGNTKNIVFVEELIDAAPIINGWQFTALKPATENKSFGLNMHDYNFSCDNLYFYANENPEFPDEIDIKIIHNDLNKDNRSLIEHGIYIFLDNYLGELEFLNNIDNVAIIDKLEAQKEMIPIEKLKAYLNWRQKEFVEKYEGTCFDTENNEFSIFEAAHENGNALVAVINMYLLNWDCKASHLWVCILTIKYNGTLNNGMPKDEDFKTLKIIEDELLQSLIDKDGYLNIGREIANGERDIYFACKDFRKPSKEFYNIQKKYAANFEMEFDIYKDKYWRTFNRFMPAY